MEAGLFHIASATTTVLVPQYGYGGSIKQISIANLTASGANNHTTIDLFLHDGGDSASSISYILKSVRIPGGVTMVIDHDISFDNGVLSLQLTSADAYPLSVIIK